MSMIFIYEAKGDWVFLNGLCEIENILNDCWHIFLLCLSGIQI